MKSRSNPFVRTAALAVIAFATASTIHAAQTYDDASASNVWDSSTLNWDGGSAWANTLTSDAIFAGTGESVAVSAVNAQSITFDSTGYSLTSGTITLGGAPAIATNADASISSVIAGSAGLTKSGTGKLTLTGTNTYTGTTTISAGTLQIGNGGTAGSLPSGAVVNNANLAYHLSGGAGNGNSLLATLPSSLSGNGNLSVNSTLGCFNLSGDINTGSGSQTYVLGSGVTYSSLRCNGATRTLTASAISITGNIGEIPGIGNLNLNTSAANGPISLNVQNGASGRLYGDNINANAGTGSITISGANAANAWSVATTLRGALNISSSFTVGALSLTATAASSVAGNLTLAAATNTFTSDPGVTLAVSGNLLTSAANPAITKNGAGTLTLSGTNTYTGATTINGGELLVPSAGSIGNNSATTVNNTGTLVIVAATGGRTLANNLTLNGGTVRGGAQDNVGTGGTVVVGTGTVTHVFTSSGTLTLQAPVTANELLVGGGGGSKSFSGWYSSGGGGGKVANLTSQSLSAGATTVTVGTGGAVGADGGATSIGANTAVGGLFATVAGKGGTSGSGNAGGAGVGVANGGGGGDSAVGGVGVNPTIGGAGGAGSANTAIVGLTGYGQLSGGSYYFGGGGGGGAQTNNALGGLGGGGQANVAGAANTGGGAGANAAGGSGIAVVQYAYNPYAVGGNLTLSGSIDVQSASTLDTYISGALMDITGVMQTTTGTGGITIASSSTAGGIVRYSNAMTYIGDTTINSGATLLVNGSTASGSTVNVASGATLGGIGTIGGATTVNGSLAPGSSVGTLTFTGGLTLGSLAASSLKFELGAPTTAGVTYDTVATNSLNIGSLDFADFQFTDTGTLAAGAYTLISSGAAITGTIGTASGSIGAFTGTLSISGNNLILTVVSGGSPYTTWAATFLPGNDVSNPAGDNDNDGLLNQQEFAFGLSPISGSSVNPILVQLDKTIGTFTYQRRAATGLTYKILTSTDLVSWPEDATATAGQVASAVDGNGNQTVVVTLTGTKPLVATKLFVRVAAD